MLLAIDIGNTNSKFAIHDGQRWRAQWRSATHTARTADEYAVWLSQLMAMEKLAFADLSACIVSSVVPQSLFHLRNLSRRYLNVEPLVVGEDGVDIGAPIRIDNPREAGADRLVNAVGAWVEYGGPCLVIDSGTATTFDLVAADGGLEGVVIAPGIALSLQALHETAAKLPRIDIRRPDRVLGKNTVGAMQSGVFWGYIDLIDGIARRLEEEYGQRLTVIGTGGVASLFEGASARIDHYDPDVTVRGLLELWRRNSGTS